MREEEEDCQDPEEEEGDPQAVDLLLEAREERNHNKPIKGTANPWELSPPSSKETVLKLRASCAK